jgi:hypothetical protein
LDGKRILSTPIPERYFGNGLNALEIDADNVLLNGLIKSYLVNANGVQKVFDRSIMYQDPEAGTTNGEVLRNDDQALVADGVIKLSNGKRGVVVMNQHDRGNYEFGFLEILSLEDGTVIDRITLPCVSEMAPVIRDVNMDGNLDILVSGYDGFLYCYQLPKY